MKIKLTLTKCQFTTPPLFQSRPPVYHVFYVHWQHNPTLPNGVWRLHTTCMKFRVQVDGSIKYGWKELRNDASAVCSEVSIAGALTLTLETEQGPKGGSCTHSGFADARVV